MAESIRTQEIRTQKEMQEYCEAIEEVFQRSTVEVEGELKYIRELRPIDYHLSHNGKDFEYAGCPRDIPRLAIALYLAKMERENCEPTFRSISTNVDNLEIEAREASRRH